jgi:hypothetical protein
VKKIKPATIGDNITVTGTPATALARRDNTALARLEQAAYGGSWGMLPVLTVFIALGLVSVAVGHTLARQGEILAGWLFWTGLILIYAPIAARLATATASRKERIGLVAILGVALYLTKILHSPLSFTFHDEFVHWRTTGDIINTNHLFSENPIIAVSPLYPGLHIPTAALADLTGLDVHNSGTLILAIARIVMVVSLFFFFEEISSSHRLAGLAALLYMANPNYMYFSSQFAYESLSLPFAALVLFAAAKRVHTEGSTRLMLNLVVVVGIIAVVMTHHLTSYALLAFLGLWALIGFLWNIFSPVWGRVRGRITNRQMFRSFGDGIVGWVRNRATSKEWSHSGSTGAALLIFAVCLTWLVYVATFTVGYLAPVLQSAVVEVIRLIAGESAGRQLFKASAGQVAPLWEQLMGFGTVIIILLGLPFGLFQVWLRFRDNALAMTLALAALAYPASLVLRLTTAGWEVSNRSSEFIFLAVSFVLAFAAIQVGLQIVKGTAGLVIFATLATAIFIGGTLVGWSPWARQPGPYLVSADTRSIETQGVSAAIWTKEQLGANNRIGADRINSLLMLSIGQQRMVMGSDKVQVAWIFMADYLGQEQIDLMRRGKIRYMVVDKRLTTQLPQVGIYYESGEPNTQKHKAPLNPAWFEKFENNGQIYRVFDSGDIVIYDVGELSGVR